MKLIVGLGNPGREYQNTRHNIGFRVVDHLACGAGLKFAESRACRGLMAEGEIEGQRCCLLLPLTYMNHSGQAVRDVVRKKNVVLSDMLVVCDDFHLDFGQMRIRKSGSGGGHNGLSSIIDLVGSNEFPRLRVGIGTPPRREEVTEFVLGAFDAGERKGLNGLIEDAARCCGEWLKNDISQVMSQFNKKGKEHE
ncbi:MAG: aminoacyl-tRNA hydrolase [Candidatus Omnitrophota bacterium]|nr:aminoacyl-tRNA hydrolase [Candidatus Omnitrophota bacterium]MDZ4242413.1 aminoacyl-tRNA hydrolase [Candidatus Omnitrophota bacterium]